MDPNNLLCMIGNWQASDVSRLTGVTFKEALSRVKAKTFVAAIDEDILFPTHSCAINQKLIPNGELRSFTACGDVMGWERIPSASDRLTPL